MSDHRAKVPGKGIVRTEIIRADGSRSQLPDLVVNRRLPQFRVDLAIRRANARAYRAGINLPKDAPGVHWWDRVLHNRRRR